MTTPSPFKQIHHRLDYGCLLALVIPLFAILPLLTYAGLPNSADGPIHLMRQVEFDQAWQEGTYYPRWGTDLAFGHGMPIFSYAPPSLYFLTQFFHLTGLTLDEAMKSVVVLDFLLYSLGMFLFARRIFGPYPALIAAAVHVYAPYRLREAYIQGNYGQFTGLACYAFILWGFHGLITDGRPRYLAVAALSLAALLLSHNISSMIFAPLLASYLIFLLIAQSRQTLTLGDTGYGLPLLYPWLRTLAGGLLGLGLAAIFWLPAFGERHDIKLEGITQDFFDFRENFLTLSELFSLPMPLDRAAINPEFPLSLGLAQIIGSGLGLLALGYLIVRHIQAARFGDSPSVGEGSLKRSLPTGHSLFFAGWLIIYAFLSLPASQRVWELVPLLELTEFPWRMLGPAILCASFVSGTAAYLVGHIFGQAQSFPEDEKTHDSRMSKLSLDIQSRAETEFRHEKKVLYWLLPIGMIIGLNLYYLYPAQFIQWGNPTPTTAFTYEIDSGAIGTTSTGEFLPRYAQQHPEPATLWPDYAAGRPPRRLDPATLPTGATVERLYHRAESEALRIETAEPFVATLRQLYWPGWQVYLNGQPAEFTITPQTGLIEVPIPAGQHTLTTQLESTPLRTVGSWLTGLSVILLLVSLLVAYRLNRSPNGLVDPQPVITAKFFALTTLLLVTAYLVTRPLAPLFTLQSDPNRPALADQLFRADFGDQIRLVGMEKLPHRVIELTPAAEMTVTLYWRALLDLETNYAVFVHLDGPNGQTFATADEPSPEFIPTSKWPPGLYLRNPVTLELPTDMPPIQYAVTVGVYNADTGNRLPLPNGDTAFRIGSVWLTNPSPNRPVEPQARFGNDIILWQATFTESLTLRWQTEQPIESPYTIFVHLLDAEGQLIGQLDGLPYGGLYPLENWLPGQLITDQRSLKPFDRPASIAIGIYDPTTGHRLPAIDATGKRLANDRLLIPVLP